MADDATIKLGYDGKKVEAGFSSLESRAKSSAKNVESTYSALASRMGTVMKGAGLVAGAMAIGRFATGQLNAADDLLDLTKRLGASAESIQRIDFLSKLNGTDVETSVNALSRLNRALADTENATASQALKTLGIDAVEFARLEPDVQLMRLAEAYQAAQEKGTGFAEIYDLIGKSAGELLPILALSKQEIQDAYNQPIISEAELTRLGSAADKMDTLANRAKKWATEATVGAGKIADQLNLTEDQTKKIEEQTEALRKRQQAVRDATAKSIDEKLKNGSPADQKEQKEKTTRSQKLTDLQSELSALSERARGNEKGADAIEREARIRQEAKRLAEETGMAEADAMRIAQTKAALEERIAKRGETETAEGGRKRIKGYSSEQYKTNRFTDRRTFEEFFAKDAHMPRQFASKEFNDAFPNTANAAIFRGKQGQAGAALGTGDKTVKMAEGQNIIQVQQLILEELKKLSS